VTTVPETARDLTAWLRNAATLIAEPDTTPGTGPHPKPGSRPPWNTVTAETLYGIAAALRDREQELRHAITGRPAHQCRRPSWTDRSTSACIQAITRLTAAAGEDEENETIRQFTRHVDAILRLPAIDLEESCRKVPAPCPRCDRPMLRLWRKSGRLACLGCGRLGQLMPGTLSLGVVEWQDGELT